MKEFGLLPKPSGYCLDYNPNLNPGILNEFATASYRWHTLVQVLPHQNSIAFHWNSFRFFNSLLTCCNNRAFIIWWTVTVRSLTECNSEVFSTILRTYTEEVQSMRPSMGLQAKRLKHLIPFLVKMWVIIEFY
jgi:hypothetical protein